MGLSQRALGQLFTPAVTTQFISNVERGVTPLPPVHVPTLSKALKVAENEIMVLLEREYTLKLSGRLSKGLGTDGAPAGDSGVPATSEVRMPRMAYLSVAQEDSEFIHSLYEAYRKADPKTQEAFGVACQNLLKVTPPNKPNPQSE